MGYSIYKFYLWNMAVWEINRILCNALKLRITVLLRKRRVRQQQLLRKILSWGKHYHSSILHWFQQLQLSRQHLQLVPIRMSMILPQLQGTLPCCRHSRRDQWFHLEQCTWSHHLCLLHSFCSLMMKQQELRELWIREISSNILIILST